MDWFGMITGLTGAVLVRKDVRIATIVWLISNAVWIFYGLQSQTLSITLMNLTYLLINGFTLYSRWRKP